MFDGIRFMVRKTVLNVQSVTKGSGCWNRGFNRILFPALIVPFSLVFLYGLECVMDPRQSPAVPERPYRFPGCSEEKKR